MSTSPEVSVVICVYNGEKYLTQAIDSVLNQTLTKFELLLIDDGSSDGSLEILRQYERKDSRCKVFTGPNQGLIHSRNMGIQEARAKYIALMDADDICMPKRLATQLQYLQAHPTCVALGSRVLLVDPDDMPIMPLGTAITHEEIDAAYMTGIGASIVNPSAMILKSAFVQVGMYQKDFVHAEDMDIFLRLAEIGQVANLPEILLHYRQHPDSIGYKHAKTQYASAEQAVRAAHIRRGIPYESKMLATQPKVEQTSPDDIHTKWAWWALHAGNIATARRHGLQALRMHPFRTSNLRLLFCLLRGH